MKIKEIIEELRYANEWRRGEDDSLEMPDTKTFGIAIDRAIEELENSDEILSASIGELQFSNLQRDFYKSILGEVEVMLYNGTKSNLIKKVIENGRERAMLDISIHYDKISK